MLAAIRGILVLIGAGGLVHVVLSLFHIGEFSLLAPITTALGLGLYGILTAVLEADRRHARMLAAAVQDIANRLGPPAHELPRQQRAP